MARTLLEKIITSLVTAAVVVALAYALLAHPLNRLHSGLQEKISETMARY